MNRILLSLARTIPSHMLPTPGGRSGAQTISVVANNLEYGGPSVRFAPSLAECRAVLASTPLGLRGLVRQRLLRTEVPVTYGYCFRVMPKERSDGNQICELPEWRQW
jgi:hypothetical protein